jgi:hypothetical protein
MLIRKFLVSGSKLYFIPAETGGLRFAPRDPVVPMLSAADHAGNFCAVVPSSAILMTVSVWPSAVPTQMLLAGSEWACPMNLIEIPIWAVAGAARRD